MPAARRREDDRVAATQPVIYDAWHARELLVLRLTER
jgi:hypothetical protein